MNTTTIILTLFLTASLGGQLVIIHESQRNFKRLRNYIDSLQDNNERRLFMNEKRIREAARETTKIKVSFTRLCKSILASY